MKMIPDPISNSGQGGKERKLSECEKKCLLKCLIGSESECVDNCLFDCNREKQIPIWELMKQ